MLYAKDEHDKTITVRDALSAAYLTTIGRRCLDSSVNGFVFDCAAKDDLRRYHDGTATVPAMAYSTECSRLIKLSKDHRDQKKAMPALFGTKKTSPAPPQATI
jgi:hypothetical protein